MNFIYIETFEGEFWVLTGEGTVSSGKVSGTWSCNTDVSFACVGQSGTFTGVQN
jgi:hypothetical protein